MSVLKEDLNQKLLPLFANEEMVEKLNACKSPEECYDIAKSYISDISPEEFQKSMALIHTYMEENKSGYLKLEDLDEVAGGTNNDFWTGFGIGVSIVGAAAGAAG